MMTIPPWVILRPGTTDAIVAHQIFRQELYKPVMGLMDYRLIIDGGANIGLSTRYFHQHHPDAVIHAIEPHAENFQRLLAHASGLTTVFLHQVALDGSGAGFSSIEDPGLGHFAMRTRPVSDRLVRDGDVRNHTVSDFLPPIHTFPVLVKLDIEGAETSLFNNPGWMQHIDVLAVELHGEEAEAAFTRAILGCEISNVWAEGETTFVVFNKSQPPRTP